MFRIAKFAAVYLILSVSLIASPASADQKIKTKSNVKNDRLVASPPGATGCATGSETYIWTVDDQQPAAGARASAASSKAKVDPIICSGVQPAIDQISASPTALSRFEAAVETCDEAALRDLMTGSGLSSALVADAQFHAINTKGTGCNNGRSGVAAARASGLVISLGYDVKKGRGYSLANWMYFNAK